VGLVAIFAPLAGREPIILSNFGSSGTRSPAVRELLTVFGRLPDGKPGAEPEDVPLVSVLRDNLGDSNPLNDRLRYVWVLSSASPTVLQRAASALPFYYWHANVGKNADRRPIAVLNLVYRLPDGARRARDDPFGPLQSFATLTAPNGGRWFAARAASGLIRRRGSASRSIRRWIRRCARR
jgi:hypothetical protein